jgi:inhibitor of the pro-sigma K processing machinery
MSDILFALLAAAVVIFLAVRIIKKPIKFIFKFLLNTVLGFIALVVIDILAIVLDLGFVVGLSWINAAVVGVFGLPGVAMLLILQLIL